MSSDEAIEAISNAIDSEYKPHELRESSFIVSVASGSDGKTDVAMRQWNCNVKQIGDRFCVFSGSGSMFLEGYSEVDLRPLEQAKDDTFKATSEFLQTVLMNELASETFRFYNIGGWYEIFEVYKGRFRSVPYSVNLWIRDRNRLFLDRRLVCRYVENGLIVASTVLGFRNSPTGAGARFFPARDLVQEGWENRPTEISTEDLLVGQHDFSVNIVKVIGGREENLAQIISAQQDILEWRFPEVVPKYNEKLASELMDVTKHYFE